MQEQQSIYKHFVRLSIVYIYTNNKCLFIYLFINIYIYIYISTHTQTYRSALYNRWVDATSHDA